MESPAAKKEEEILEDLIRFINERGGAVGCERLQDFFVRHPGHRPLLKSMGGAASFCKKHPARISVGRGDGPHLRLKVLPGQQGQETNPATGEGQPAASDSRDHADAIKAGGHPRCRKASCCLQVPTTIIPYLDLAALCLSISAVTLCMHFLVI